MNGVALLELADPAAAHWDAVVIGAGPAGALAAHQLASHGLRTLVVDAKRFPRAKVCGGCLNRRGVAVLDKAGLARVVETSRTNSAHSLHWIVGRQRVRLALPELQVVDRALFDSALVHEAVRAGATFVDGVTAYIEPHYTRGQRRLTMTRQAERVESTARVVIAANGLGRTGLKRLDEIQPVVAPHSRIGVGATLPRFNEMPANEITMVVGQHGYVGLAASHLECWNVAAALDASAVAKAPVDSLVCEMLAGAGVLSQSQWPRIEWHGTPPLTSRPTRVAAERLFVIGDASGYVEPFSGEGMATALQTALAVAPLAAAAVYSWRPSLATEWEQAHRQIAVDQQATCRQLAWILRHGWAAATAIGLCRVQPWIAHRFIAKVS